MSFQIHPQLLAAAQWRLEGEPGSEKAAFAPPVDPAAGGMPPAGGAPADPAMAAMGGAPPMDPMAGGAPPMDPMAGGAPPMDPMAGGAPPMDPSMGAPPPDIQMMITQAVQTAMGGGGAGGAPGAAGKPKIDPAFIYMELSRTRKLLTHLLQNMQIDLPADILDDGSVAQTMTGAQPDSSPIGQEGAPPEQAPPGLPGIGSTAPISPIDAPKTAAATMFGKSARNVGAPITSETFVGLNRDLDALATLSRGLHRG